MLITIFTFVSITLALQSTVAACDCSVCELDKVFNATRGYACFIASDNTPICTCPDQRFEVNKRCRICDRANTCGNKDDVVFCSEISSQLGQSEGDSASFACFCKNGQFYRGQKCPSGTTTSTSTTQTTTPAPVTTTTTPAPATTTTTASSTTITTTQNSAPTK